MTTFSQRQGLVNKAIQIDSMDSDLRNSLWNGLVIYYWITMQSTTYLRGNKSMDMFVKRLWLNHFKAPIDSLRDEWPYVLEVIRTYFFSCTWNEVYDFIEFVVNNCKPYDDPSERFIEWCNEILARESSGYRFVGNMLSPVIAPEEINAIEDALDQPTSLRPVSNHLERALRLLSDRKEPDYRNSVKESISAVEAMCKIVTGDPNATLGKALVVLKKKVGLHQALENAFSNLYGYTSDADGIRHALMGESNLGFDDAKYFLVSCSAFINYLKSKCTSAGTAI